MQNIAYITEAGKKVGFGHLTRANVIKKIINDADIDIILEQNLSSDWNHNYKVWRADKSLKYFLRDINF